MREYLRSQDMCDFRQSIHREFNDYLDQRFAAVDLNECLKIDLHCHDLNSDKPDELWGRMLGLPESWVKTKHLEKCLKKNACDVVTITNHNNARSCWDLMEQGKDVLVGCEFTCYFPEYQLFVHVLTYGFTREQEVTLNEKRGDIYAFLRYTTAHDIPVILPHPLYFYTRNEHINLELFEKLAVMFQSFEVLNGQRDQWQSVLTLNWVQSLTPDKIRAYAAKHTLSPDDFGVNPDQPKVLSGGSDDHMGIFAGECGTYLHVPNLQERLKHSTPSELALEAMRAGRMVAYGCVTENQKLNIALLDYFSQVATHIKDPGMLRLLFHRGEVSDKIACLVISNLLLEMQKHKNTQKFFEAIHDALQGKKLNKILKWKTKKDYRFCIDYLDAIAERKTSTPEIFIKTVNEAVPALFRELNLLMIRRFKKSTSGVGMTLNGLSTKEIARKFEIPSQLTALLGDGHKKSDFASFNINQLLDHLSFPSLVSVVLLGTTIGSTRLLYQNRTFLNDFSEHLGCNQHPKRALYLTDTLLDKNGVSNSLSGKLKEIQRMNMPVDFLICHEHAEAAEHLHVVRPLTTFSLPDMADLVFRLPDFMEISRIFYEGGYDRIICSTEGPMAIVSLLIKHMFNVPCFFFMHTDWIDFIKDNTNLTEHERDRVRRVLRFFYKQYDGVFVLNNEHRQWLTGHHMQLDEARVFLTAHHTQPQQDHVLAVRKQELFEDASDDTPILLFASRLSKEKGLFDLPEVMKRVHDVLPDVRIVIAGSGPADEEIKQRLPDACYLGWVDRERMLQLYAGLDLFVFPSRFDTFGNVILEAFTYGMPVVAYNCKGPADLIEDAVSGYLVEDVAQMSDRIIHYLQHEKVRQNMHKQAKLRTQAYQPEPIMRQFLADMGLAI